MCEYFLGALNMCGGDMGPVWAPIQAVWVAIHSVWVLIQSIWGLYRWILINSNSKTVWWLLCVFFGSLKPYGVCMIPVWVPIQAVWGFYMWIFLNFNFKTVWGLYVCMFWLLKALWGLFDACMGPHTAFMGVVYVNFF